MVPKALPYTANLKCAAVAFWMLGGLVPPAWAVEGAPLPSAEGGGPGFNPAFGVPAPVFTFDIPAQQLQAALNQYAAVSGQPALFPSDIVASRTSTAVRGRYSAESALQVLLQGTGLVADRRNSGLGRTFVLKEAGTAAPVPGSGMAELFREDGYPGLVQMLVWQALCASARTRPGDYTALLRFHIEADGRIGGARIIGSSGDDRRDTALVDTLRGLPIDRPPPPAIARRPLTVVVVPNDPLSGPRCSHAYGAG